MLSGAVSRAAWIAAIAVGLSAAPAWAAEVVQVRVGNHPTFTRVVFELDAPAGYRVERRTAEDGGSEILVTLDATSAPRSVASRSVMVERVAVQDGLERSVAHIRLKKSPSRVKELILADPPRIVFDLLLPEPELQAVRLTAARKAEAKARAEVEQRAKAEERELTAAPKPAALPPKPPPTRPAPLAKAGKIASPAVPPPPAPEASPAPGPARAGIAKAQAEPQPRPEPPVAKAAGVKPPEAAAKPAAPGRETPGTARTSMPPKRAEPRRAAVPRPIPASAAAGGSNWIAWGGMAAGGLVVLLVVVLLLRRRALPNDLDVMALAEEKGDEGAIAAEGFAMGAGEAAEPPSEEAISHQTPVGESPSGGPGIAAGPGLFDDEPEKESETMDTESPARPTEQTASELPTQMGTGAEGEGDLARLVRELERRVVQIETRLDESIDARERLERQVAAQSEELRVQRAAIARTQRALRSLNRGETEQATEPALREPPK